MLRACARVSHGILSFDLSSLSFANAMTGPSGTPANVASGTLFLPIWIWGIANHTEKLSDEHYQ
jgi:hypothetical protein